MGLCWGPKSRTEICDGIEYVYAKGERVYVMLKGKMTEKNVARMAMDFGFMTSAWDSPLLMPPGSARNVEVVDGLLSFEFPFPFVMEYSGDLVRVNRESYMSPPFHFPELNQSVVIWSQLLNVSVDDFRGEFEGSQMKCHGTSFKSRWCEAHDIGVVSGNFIIETKAHYVFPSPFISTGGRSPPFDDREGWITNGPIVAVDTIKRSSIRVLGRGEVVLICDIGINYNTSRGVVFDFMFPVVETLQSIKVGARVAKFVKFKAKSEVNADLVASVTGEMGVMQREMEPVILERVVIGLKKVDGQAPAKYEYNFGEATGGIVRERVFNKYGIAGVERDSGRQIMVTFVECENGNVTNMESLKQTVIDLCGSCIVETLMLDARTGDRSIVESVAKSDVLISQSGCGLEHVLWLKPGSVAVEMRPDSVWCTNTAEIAANVSGAHYQSVIVGTVITRNCTYCETDECDRMMRSKSVTVDLPRFRQAWKSVLSLLDRG